MNGYFTRFYLTQIDTFYKTKTLIRETFEILVLTILQVSGVKDPKNFTKCLSVGLSVTL